MVRHPADQEAGFLHHQWVLVVRRDEGDVRSVVPHADNNVYFSIPHPAGDPVVAANKDGVLEFLRTTFFDNAAALECQLAAISSTLRGVSIVRAFITVGGSHGFMEMNVFVSEDELRKQAVTFTGKVIIREVTYLRPRTRKLSLSWFFSGGLGPPCVLRVVTTGQDAPSTDKRLHEDLCKKVAGTLWPPVSRTPSWRRWSHFPAQRGSR